MKELVTIAEKIATQLIARKQTIAVAESSTGGLISAALLSVPGASAYFLGGAVVYTRDARRLLMDIPDEAMKGIRSASEPYAKLLASQIRQRFATDWGFRKPARRDRPAIATATPRAIAAWRWRVRKTTVFTLETGSADRQANMQAFAKTALNLLLENLSK